MSIDESNTTNSNATGQRLLRLPEVLQRLGCGRTFFLDRVRGGQFPKPIKLGRRIAVWPESAVSALVQRICGEDAA